MERPAITNKIRIIGSLKVSLNSFQNVVGSESGIFVDKHSLFRGAVVFDGEGILDVRKVGLKTMMGKMAEEMQNFYNL